MARRLIIRHHRDGMEPAHIAAVMGISRECVYTWLGRYTVEAEAEAGLERLGLVSVHDADQDPALTEEQVVAARAQHRVCALLLGGCSCGVVSWGFSG